MPDNQKEQKSFKLHSEKLVLLFWNSLLYVKALSVIRSLETKSFNVREKWYEDKEVIEKHLILKLNGKYPHRLMNDFCLSKKKYVFPSSLDSKDQEAMTTQSQWISLEPRLRLYILFPAKRNGDLWRSSQVQDWEGNM